MVSGFPDYTSRAFTSAENSEQLKISATASEATSSFAQEVKSFLIYNDGNNPVHLNYDATATTNSFKLVAKAWQFLDLKLTDVHTICATGETATLFVIGLF